jgi:hypothetical protein
MGEELHGTTAVPRQDYHGRHVVPPPPEGDDARRVTVACRPHGSRHGRKASAQRRPRGPVGDRNACAFSHVQVSTYLEVFLAGIS